MIDYLDKNPFKTNKNCFLVLINESYKCLITMESI